MIIICWAFSMCQALCKTTRVVWLNSSKPRRLVLALFLFYSWGSWGTERQNNLSKSYSWQVVCLQSPSSYTLCMPLLLQTSTHWKIQKKPLTQGWNISSHLCGDPKSLAEEGVLAYAGNEVSGRSPGQVIRELDFSDYVWPLTLHLSGPQFSHV